MYIHTCTCTCTCTCMQMYMYMYIPKFFRNFLAFGSHHHHHEFYVTSDSFSQTNHVHRRRDIESTPLRTLFASKSYPQLSCTRQPHQFKFANYVEAVANDDTRTAKLCVTQRSIQLLLEAAKRTAGIEAKSKPKPLYVKRPFNAEDEAKSFLLSVAKMWT